MHQDRVFDSAHFFQAGEELPPRVVLTESSDSAVVCWHVESGQHIDLHAHSSGQDTRIVLAGEGQYFPDQSGHFLQLRPGFVAVATRGAERDTLTLPRSAAIYRSSRRASNLGTTNTAITTASSVADIGRSRKTTKLPSPMDSALRN